MLNAIPGKQAQWKQMHHQLRCQCNNGSREVRTYRAGQTVCSGEPETESMWQCCNAESDERSEPCPRQ